MRDSRLARTALAAFVLGGLAGGCGSDSTQVPTETTATDARAEVVSVSPPPPSVPPIVPRPWADWPAENVAPAAWFGWRLEPSGQYTHVPGLRLTTAEGALVLAIADGVVRDARLRDDGAFDVTLVHPDGSESRYHPLSATLVYSGMPVTRGSTLGIAKGPETTLEVSIGGELVDPLVILRSPLQLARPGK